jgi:5-methylcytosine-specific restriction endonuclease McrA
MRTLLLDNGYFPVQIITWQKAMILCLTGRAEIIECYQNQLIRSPSKDFPLPKILRLFSRHKAINYIKFSRFNVFMRDDHTCQYCGIRGDSKNLTFDHVIPQSRGGNTCWGNIVTACADCNSRKGNKYISEAGMSLLKRPGPPAWNPKVCLRLKESDPHEWTFWFPFGDKAS